MTGQELLHQLKSGKWRLRFYPSAQMDGEPKRCSLEIIPSQAQDSLTARPVAFPLSRALKMVERGRLKSEKVQITASLYCMEYKPVAV